MTDDELEEAFMATFGGNPDDAVNVGISGVAAEAWERLDRFLARRSAKTPAQAEA
jgi:hypothetical protein